MLLNVSLPRLRLVAFLLFTFLGQVLLGSTFEVSETPIDLRSASQRVAFSLGDDHIWTAAVVQVLDPVTGAGTGTETYIYRTTDGGSSWEQFSVEHDRDPFGLHFFNSADGILYSDGMFSRTSDGGQTWTHQNLPKGADSWPSLMYVLDEAHIWVFASNQYTYRTKDGGNTWTVLPGLFTVTAINFLDENTGFGIHSGLGVAKTVDGGESWVALELPITVVGNISGLFFLNENVGFVTGEESVSPNEIGSSIFRTINGGRTWSKYLSTEEISGRVYFASNSVGFVFGEKIFRTANGGTTWDVVYENEYDLSLSGFLSTPLSNTVKTGAVLGYREWILRTQDGGVTWNEEYMGLPNSWLVFHYDFGFISEKEGYAILDSSFDDFGDPLYRTLNGGQTWMLVNLPNQNGSEIRDVFIADNGTGWTVGQSGKMWKKEAASELWVEQNLGVNYVLSNVQFEDSFNGWVSGAEGVLRTKDGGENWAEVDFGVSVPYAKAYYNNAALSWVVGSGTLFTTDDNGESWLRQGEDFGEGLISVEFNLYNINEYGASLRVSGLNNQTYGSETRWYRIESGESDWEAISEEDAVPYGTIHQIDDCHALLFGDSLQATYDGGVTWTTIGDLSELYNVDFVGNDLVYVIASGAWDLRKIEFEYSETLVGTFSTSVEAAFPMTIDFPTEVGLEYVIEYSNDLTNWNRLCESRFTATETTKSWTENNWEIEDPTNASRFYRVWKFDEQ